MKYLWFQRETYLKVRILGDTCAVISNHYCRHLGATLLLSWKDSKKSPILLNNENSSSSFLDSKIRVNVGVFNRTVSMSCDRLPYSENLVSVSWNNKCRFRLRSHTRKRTWSGVQGQGRPVVFFRFFMDRCTTRDNVFLRLESFWLIKHCPPLVWQVRRSHSIIQITWPVIRICEDRDLPLWHS